MRTSLFAVALITLALTPQTSQAQGFLDSLNNVINKVDQTITSGERAQNTAERIMDKVPEGEEQPEAQQPTTASQEANKTQPASGTMTTDEEEEILKRAREIEERRILEEAERIKKEREMNN